MNPLADAALAAERVATEVAADVVTVEAAAIARQTAFTVIPSTSKTIYLPCLQEKWLLPLWLP